MSSKSTDFKNETSDNTAYPVQEFFTYIIQGKKNSFSQIFVPLSLRKNFACAETLGEILKNKLIYI